MKFIFKIIFTSFILICFGYVAHAQNNPEANKKEFEKLLLKFNNTTSSNSSFSGYINPYPSNPSDSYYKQDYYNNQLIYDGYMKKVVTSTNGNTVYQDVFKHGKGKEYIINSNGYLDGYFLNGKLNGYGEHVSPGNGFSYKGYFVNGERNGEGILVMDGLSGTTKYIYEGAFSNGKYNGKGTITYNFMSYTGSFVNNQISGSGVYLYPNGSKYVGNSINGKFEGYGEYYFADGSYYKGNFSSGYYNGLGELSYANGTKQKGAWQNGNYVVETVKEDSPNIANNQPRSSLIEGRASANNTTENSANKTKSNGNVSASLLTANDLDNLLGNFIRDVLDGKIESNTSSSSKNKSSVQSNSTNSSAGFARCRIYLSKYSSGGDPIGYVDGNRIYSGKYSSGGNPVGYIDGNRIYSSKYSSGGNPVGYVDGNRIYSGKYSSGGNPVGYIDANRVYLSKYSSGGSPIGYGDGCGLLTVAAAALLLLL
jgi:hypothetical protein